MFRLGDEPRGGHRTLISRKRKAPAETGASLAITTQRHPPRSFSGQASIGTSTVPSARPTLAESGNKKAPAETGAEAVSSATRLSPCGYRSA
jgi:hypothetical protein